MGLGLTTGMTGWQIVTSKHMSKQVLVLRSWKERLFSWPWRPFQSHKRVKQPMEDVLVDHRRLMIYCHPVRYRQIKKMLAALEGSK